MLDKSLRFGVSIFLTALVPCAYAACSSTDAAAPATGPDASMTGTGGKGTGGKTSTGGGGGGATASGGAAPIDVDAAYACQRQPERDPGGTGAEGATCCLNYGKCTKASDVTDPVLLAAYGHDSCKPGSGGDDLKCVPTAAALADAGTLGVFDKCTTNLGASLEGRCLPKCFIGGNPQASLLKQETCSSAELVCAPCFNPVDGKPTGACSQKPGDPPTTQPPTPFKACGSLDGGPALGLCVPKQLALDTGNPAAPSLKQLECANATDVCAPSLKVKDPNACFQQCDSFIAGPGGCVAAFLVEAVQPGASANLGGANCQPGELCAPCLNPLSMPPNLPSGACN